MIIKDTESVDIHTSTGPMRTYLFRPAAEERYPGLLLKNNSYTGTKGKATRLLRLTRLHADSHSTGSRDHDIKHYQHEPDDGG